MFHWNKSKVQPPSGKVLRGASASFTWLKTRRAFRLCFSFFFFFGGVLPESCIPCKEKPVSWVCMLLIVWSRWLKGKGHLTHNYPRTSSYQCLNQQTMGATNARLTCTGAQRGFTCAGTGLARWGVSCLLFLAWSMLFICFCLFCLFFVGGGIPRRGFKHPFFATIPMGGTLVLIGVEVVKRVPQTRPS